MSELDLAAIRARADAAVDEAYTWREVVAGLAESGMDVPALLAEVERLRVENRGLALQLATNGWDDMRQYEPADPATLVLSPEIWCDVCGAWHIPTSCSATNAAGVASSGPRAANEPAQVAADPARADNAPQVPLLDEWCRRHEDDDARPIGPPFTMPKTQAGEGQS